MNRAYRIVWNASRQLWMVAGELTRGRTKSQQSRQKQVTRVVGQTLRMAASLAYAGGAMASSGTYWTGGNGNWENFSYWDRFEVPTDGDTVYLKNGTTTTVDTTVQLGNSVVNIAYDSQSTVPSTLLIKDGGKLTIRRLYLGASDEKGNVMVTGSGSILTAEDFYIGNAGGAGTLTVQKGARLTGIGPYSSVYLTDASPGSMENTGTLIIGAAEGETAVQAGSVEVASLVLGNGTSKIVLNHTSTDSDYVLTSNISSNNPNANHMVLLSGGSTRFTGQLRNFFGTMKVDGGSLSIAAGDTLALGQTGVTADYSQTLNGLLRLGLIDTSHYGKLQVSGTANFVNGAKLDVDVKNQDSITNGALLTDVITAGTLNANSFNVTDNSALYNFAAEINGNSVGLRIRTASSAGETDKGVLKSVNREGLTPGRGAARVLDGFVNGGATGTDIDNVTTALGQLSNDQEITEAVAETLPLLVGGTTKFAANTLHSTNRVIQSRQANTRGLSSGDAFLTDKNMWLKPVGSWTRQQERNGVSGYDADSYGFVVGMDGDVTSSSRLGLALSYMNTRVDGNGMSSGNKADIDAYQLIAYGSHDLAQFENVELNWQADVGMNKNDSKRQISFIGRTAEADYDSYTAHVGVGVGKRFELNENSTVMPSIRADYAYIRDESYTEKGAGAISLDVDSVHTDEFILMAQTDIDHQLNDKTTLLANMGIGYDLINDDTSMTASYTGGGTAFTTEGIDPSPWLARAGVGATVNINDYTDITAQYDVEGREDFLNQTASVKLRLSF